MLPFLLAPIAGLILVAGSAHLFYRFGWKSFVLMVLPAIAMPLFFGEVRVLPNFLGPIIVGATGGYAYRNGKQFDFILIISSLATAVLMTAAFFYHLYDKNIDFITMIKNEMTRSQALMGMPADYSKQMLGDLEKIGDFIIDLIPYTVFIYCLVLCGVGYLIIKKIFEKIVPQATIKGLEFFRLNDFAIFALIAGWAMFLFIDPTLSRIASAVGFNIGMIMLTLYFVQALGVIKFMLLKKGWSGYLLPVFMMGIILTGPPGVVFAIIILSGVGTLDLWADFRKLQHVEGADAK